MARRFAKSGGRGQAINSKNPYDLADMVAYHMLQTTHFYVQVKMNINYELKNIINKHIR
jgi:hypothetical protein